MERTITHENCSEGLPLPEDELKMDKTRSSFILKNKFRKNRWKEEARCPLDRSRSLS